MPAPLVTVLLPVYNGAETIEDAVTSVLRQTMPDFELLIVDDGSTDDTHRLLMGIDDPRLRVITHDRNLGIVASLNEGLEAARAPLVARLDADDRCVPDRLALQCQRLLASPEIGVLAGGRRKIDPRGKPLGDGFPPTTHAAIALRLLFGNCLAHPTVMFRRELVMAAGGYRQAAYPAEDYDLWLRLARQTLLEAVPQLLIEYRVTASGISASEFAEQRSRTLELSAGALEDRLGRAIDRRFLSSVIFGRPEGASGEGGSSRDAVDLVLAAADSIARECRDRGIAMDGLRSATADLLLRETVLGRGRSRFREVARILLRDPSLVTDLLRRVP
jgi:glycosyltransferase involved in cell wall biosynthesis